MSPNPITTKNSLARDFNLPPPRAVTHVIFDMDGLLIDSEDYYTIGTNNVANRFGKEFTWETKVKVMGTTATHSASLVIEELGLPLSVDEWLDLLTEEYSRLFPLCNLLPGVESLLDHLKSHSVPMAIASSSKKASFEAKTSKFGSKFTNYFDHILLAPEEPLVKESKPAPDSFLVAKERFSSKPRDHLSCLVFEDSVAGAIAGCRAGMQVIWIPDQRLDVRNFLTREMDLKPTQILTSMTEFNPIDFGLPPFVDVNRIGEDINGNNDGN